MPARPASSGLPRLAACLAINGCARSSHRPLPSHPRLLNPIVDGESLPEDSEWWAVDAAICTLGTTRAKAGSAAAFRAIDHDYALEVAERVRAGGAGRFALVSAMGANARSPFLYPRTKGELEEAVDRLGFPSLTILRPGLLGGHRQESRPMEQAGEKLARWLAPILPDAARISPAATVAALLVRAALDGGPGRHVIGSAEIAKAARARD